MRSAILPLKVTLAMRSDLPRSFSTWQKCSVSAMVNARDVTLTSRTLAPTGLVTDRCRSQQLVQRRCQHSACIMAWRVWYGTAQQQQWAAAALAGCISAELSSQCCCCCCCTVNGHSPPRLARDRKCQLLQILGDLRDYAAHAVSYSNTFSSHPMDGPFADGVSCKIGMHSLFMLGVWRKVDALMLGSRWSNAADYIKIPTCLSSYSTSLNSVPRDFCNAIVIENL